jgi:predicted TIM-barrel fold metal-dependent hydrolase
MNVHANNFRDLAAAEFDTTTLLAHAADQAIERRYEDFCIVDVDCHHYETEAFNEILQYMEDPVIRHEAKYQGTARGGIASADGSYQEIGGRITRYPGRRIEKVPPTPHRDITLMRRWMDAMGVDIACMFPTPMLNLASCPRVEVEVAMAQAYNRWLCEKILGEENRFKSMLYLPFNDPDACYKTVLEFADRKGVIGFMVTATHYRGVYDNAYAKTYAALQERNLPLAFHAAFNWVNGMPERFPRLKTVWIESGLAWIPFLMQRLDNEYMMRTSDCALLKKKPSDYMRDMFFTSQPMEMVDNREALQLTFKMINAETQLLYSSDYPHWDMDLPSTIHDLPFLSEQAKRNILGDNARRLFNLEPVLSEAKQLRKAARTQQQPEINKVFGVASAAE